MFEIDDYRPFYVCRLFCAYQSYCSFTVCKSFIAGRTKYDQAFLYQEISH